MLIYRKEHSLLGKQAVAVLTKREVGPAIAWLRQKAANHGTCTPTSTVYAKKEALKQMDRTASTVHYRQQIPLINM